MVDLAVAGLISTTPDSPGALPGGPKNNFRVREGPNLLPAMLNEAPSSPDFGLSATTGGTIVNDLRIVSCGTQLPVKLLTLHMRTL